MTPSGAADANAGGQPGLFSRLRSWSRRLDDKTLLPDWQPVGLNLAEEPVRSEILRLAYPRRMWLYPPVVVADDDFVTEWLAASTLSTHSALRLRTASLKWVQGNDPCRAGPAQTHSP